MRAPWTAGLVVALAGGAALATLAWRGPDPEAAAAAEEAGPSVAEPSARERADALFDAGRTDAAFEGYLLAVEAAPDDLEAYRRLALIAVLRQDWTQVRRFAGELARLDPGAPATAAATAALDFQAGGDAARGGVSAARTILADHPGELIARWVVIRSLLQDGSPCAAIPEIDAAIAEAPSSYEFEEMRLAALGAAGDRAGAGEQLRRMRAKFPGNAQVGEWLLESLEAGGDTAGAAGLLREMAAAAGDDAGPGLRLASYLRSTQGDEAADAELARLADAAGGAALAGTYRAELARSLEGQGRHAEAASVLEGVIADPATPRDQAGDAGVALAGLLRRTGESDKAKALLDDILRTSPSHVGALEARASWLIEEGDAAGALDALRVAQGQRPNDPGILALTGTAYALQGSDALAGDSFARAVEESDGGERETQLYAGFLRERGRAAAADALLGMERQDAEDAGGDLVAGAAPVPPSRSCAAAGGPSEPPP